MNMTNVHSKMMNVWTVDGKTMFRNSDHGKPNVYYG